jgi:hypothetical protein
MEKKYACQSLTEPLRESSEEKDLLFKMKTRMLVIKDTGYARIKYKFLRIVSKKSNDVAEKESLNLQPGDFVMVRPLSEIAMTLDERGRHKGLYFMPEMEKFCGKKFKVFKKIETILLEATGELRKIKSPTYFLEGVHCDGSKQGGCDRACFHYWREDWLTKNGVE